MGARFWSTCMIQPGRERIRDKIVHMRYPGSISHTKADRLGNGVWLYFVWEMR